MLRDPSLIPLSHQHHNGLALCVMTRRSLAADSSPGNVAKLARRAVGRYELELANHFEIEEQVLFPACGELPPIALLEQFCALLSTHIRREENELFEQIQRALPREVLDRAGSEIDRRAVRICL